MRSVLGEPVKIQQCACNCQLPATRWIQFTQQTSAKTIIGKVRLCKIYIMIQHRWVQSSEVAFFKIDQNWRRIDGGGWFTLFPTILSPSSWAPSMGHPSLTVGQAEAAEERHHHRQISAMATDDRSTASGGDKFYQVFRMFPFCVIRFTIVSQSFHMVSLFWLPF